MLRLGCCQARMLTVTATREGNSPVTDVKRTSVNLDSAIVADARIAILEAERLGLDRPRNLSAMVNESLKLLTQTMRAEIDLARASHGQRIKPSASKKTTLPSPAAQSSVKSLSSDTP